MKPKYVLIFAGFLLALNIFAWQEVFVLTQQNGLKVDFFDVGQGDSAFIETSQGHQILIDGGPTSAVLEKLSQNMPFWDRSIDVVILTHPELDHMAGIMEVLQRYSVDYFVWPGVERNTPEYKKLAQILQEKQSSKDNFLLASLSPQPIKVITAKAGQKIKAGNALIYIIYPSENEIAGQPKNTSNDSGIVCKLVFGNNSFLFTGDMSSKLEKDLLENNIDFFADVLKVAHHGSKYSTSDIFLGNARPKTAVISVGKNSYGHPAPDTLQRLQNYDIKTLRTDQLGDITILSDGNNIHIK